jgi:hypothetical protein
MIVIRHQAKSVTEQVVPLDTLGENAQELPPISIVEIDDVATVSAREHVIERPRVLKAQRSSDDPPRR